MQQRPAERGEAEHDGQVLAERGLDRVQAAHAGAVEQRQQGEQQPGENGREQSLGGFAGPFEAGRHQQQAQAHQPHDEDFLGADAFAEQQALQQQGEGRETGEAEGGDGDAGHIHRMEEGDPVGAQQQAAEPEQGQLAQVGVARLAAGDQLGEQRQGDHREQPAAEGDDHGGAVGELAENPRKPEQQGPQVDGQQRVAFLHARRAPLGSGLSKLARTTLLSSSWTPVTSTSERTPAMRLGAKLQTQSTCRPTRCSAS
ncbi:hypothetical protein D3C84_733610 [compost metagenome]